MLPREIFQTSFGPLSTNFMQIHKLYFMFPYKCLPIANIEKKSNIEKHFRKYA